MSESELKALIAEYKSRFGELPPFELMPPRLDILKVMRKCLKTGKAYEIGEETRALLDDAENDL